MFLNIIYLNLINTTLELWGFLFTLSCAIIAYTNRKDDPSASIPLSRLLLVNAFMLLADATGNLFTGHMDTVSDFFVRFCYSMHFTLIGLLPLFAILYIKTMLKGNELLKNTLVIGSAFCSFIMVGMVVRNIFSPYLFYFNSLNYYFRAQGYEGFSMVGVVQMMFVGALLLALMINKETRNGRLFLPVIMLPLAGDLLQLKYYGLNLNTITITVCLMILFVNYQAIINHKFYEKRSILAQKDAELALTRVQVSISQMQPHFLFNSLGSIEQLCKTSPGMAAEATHHFSQYLRNNINALSRSSLITFGEEMDHIRNYIWLEKMRFGNDLEFHENIEFDDFLLPALSVQPLVENGIKIGMRLCEGTLAIHLEVKEDDENVTIVIYDNCGGFDVNDPPPNEERALLGLEEIRNRIQLMFGGTVEFEGRVNGGSRMTMCIPKEEAAVQEKAV